MRYVRSVPGSSFHKLRPGPYRLFHSPSRLGSTPTTQTARVATGGRDCWRNSNPAAFVQFAPAFSLRFFAGARRPEFMAASSGAASNSDRCPNRLLVQTVLYHASLPFLLLRLPRASKLNSAAGEHLASTRLVGQHAHCASILVPRLLYNLWCRILLPHLGFARVNVKRPRALVMLTST